MIHIRIAGNDSPALTIIRLLTIHTRDDTTRFADEQNSCRVIPRPEIEFPEAVEEPTCDVTQVECGGSGASNIRDVADHAAELREIRIQHIRFFEWKSGSD